jgi:SAM-dependent methyltransferase
MRRAKSLDHPLIYRSLRTLHTARTRQQHRHTVGSLDELDSHLDAADKAFAQSHDAGLRALNSFRYRPPTDLPTDASSSEYRERQLDFYRQLSGNSDYSASRSELSVVNAAAEPSGLYPYSTRSPKSIGEQLLALGHAVETMNLPPGSRVTEFGPGWGHLTVQLALTGYDVTAVEINPLMAEIISAQAARNNVHIHVDVCDMVEHMSPEPMDAAVFFESFHHCFDFHRLLDRLDQSVSNRGIIALIAEPIGPFPFPWGLRLDGLSLWSIRREGWCELGFSTAYFKRVVESRGWKATRHRRRGSRLTDMWILSRV